MNEKRAYYKAVCQRFRSYRRPLRLRLFIEGRIMLCLLPEEVGELEGFVRGRRLVTTTLTGLGHRGGLLLGLGLTVLLGEHRGAPQQGVADVVDLDLHAGAVGAVVGLPGALAGAARDDDALAGLEALGDVFGEATPGGAGPEGGLGLLLAVALPGAVDRDGEVGHRGAVAGVAELGLARHVPTDRHVVVHWFGHLSWLVVGFPFFLDLLQLDGGAGCFPTIHSFMLGT